MIVTKKRFVCSALVFSPSSFCSLEIVRQWIKKEEEEEGEADLLKRREIEWMSEEKEKEKKNERLLSWLLKYDNTHMNCTLSMISRKEKKK